MKLEEMARNLLNAPAGDVVLLAQGASPEGLDLTALSEYESRPGGGVRVRLMDKGALLAALVKAGWLDEGNTDRAERLWQALEGGSRAEFDEEPI